MRLVSGLRRLTVLRKVARMACTHAVGHAFRLQARSDLVWISRLNIVLSDSTFQMLQVCRTLLRTSTALNPSSLRAVVVRLKSA